MKNDMFPKPNSSQKLRALLRQINGTDEQLTNDLRYKSGYEDGFTMGKLEAQEDAKCLVRALTRLYDNGSDLAA
jgi:hypothetical protein